MAYKQKLSAMWESTKKHMAAHADALKAWTGAALKDKAAGIRGVIGPEKAESIKEPERPFGKEGGEDVKRVVWTGHKITSPESKSYYGAVGLTQGGYYRAAEVQVYGSDEQWRWQPGQYAVRDDAVKSATRITDTRKGERRMAQNQIPPELAAKARAEVESSGMRANSLSVQAEKQSQAIDTYADKGKALELAREQARQTERLPATHDHKQPTKE